MVNIFNLIYLRILNKLKLILWATFPFIFIFLYKKNKNKNLVIIPHSGLGDLASLIPAFLLLSSRHKLIYLYTNRIYFNVVKEIFNLPTNIYNINYEQNNRFDFILNNHILNSLRNYGHVIKLGHFANDYIYKYPNSFYLKLGINPKFAIANFDYKDFVKENEYVYINIEDSTNSCISEYNFAKIIEILKKNDIKTIYIYGNYLEKAVLKNFNIIDLKKIKFDTIEQSIKYNIRLCMNSTLSILSDAGIYNIIIRLKKHPKLFILTRPHKHSHNNLIYKIKFNGKIQSCSFN